MDEPTSRNSLSLSRRLLSLLWNKRGNAKTEGLPTFSGNANHIQTNSSNNVFFPFATFSVSKTVSLEAIHYGILCDPSTVSLHGNKPNKLLVF